jgi:hypothetical protein
MLYASASDRQGVGMVENVSALDAYLEGELPLPPRYAIEHGADVLLVRREGGSVVALQRRGRDARRGEADRLGRPQAKHQHGLRTHPPSMPA